MHYFLILERRHTLLQLSHSHDSIKVYTRSAEPCINYGNAIEWTTYCTK